MIKTTSLVAVLSVAAGVAPSLRAQPADVAALEADASTETVVERWRSFHSRFVATECWFAGADVPAMDGIACGTVDVPEDRADPGSRMISLAVMRIPAASQPARSGTLVWLDPGPGNASISASRVRTLANGPLAGLHRDVDLVLFDQRGTGHSETDACRVVQDSWTYGVRLQPEGEALFIANMGRCLEAARAQGIAIDTYSSWHIALDARDIRLALGLDQWNVFGFGTSTEIAQALVQVDRDGVRAVVLDGPVPTQASQPRATSLNMDMTLRALSDLCRQDAGCASLHGDFHQRLLATLDVYEREPLLIEGLDPRAATNGRLVFDDRIAATFVMFMLYNANSHADLPVVLSALEDRDAGAIGNYAQAWFQPANGRDSQLTRYAIKCRNNSGGRNVPPVALEQASREASGIYRRLGLFRYDDECRELPYGPPDPAMRATRSDVPALVTDGKLNPVGTFEDSQALAAGFSNGRMVLFPYAGVTPIVNDLRGCGGELLVGFLADPMASLDTACASDGKPPAFLTDYRRTSLPGRLLIGLSQGKLPFVPIAIVIALALPFVGLPVAWLVRRWRRRASGVGAVGWPGLFSWTAAATALGAIAHFAMTMLAWAKAHPAALPAAVPSTLVASAVVMGIAGVVAILGLWMTRGRASVPGHGMHLSTAGWVAVGVWCGFAWLVYML